MHNPSRVVRQARVSGHVRTAHGFTQALEYRITVSADDDVFAIRAKVGIGWYDAGNGGAGRLSDHTGAVVFRDNAFHHVEHRLVQRCVDHLSVVAGIFKAVQAGHDDAKSGVQAGERVAYTQVHTHRPLTRQAVDVTYTTHAFADRSEARFGRIGAILAIAGYTRINQTWVAVRKILRAQAPFFHSAGPEILDQHIALFHQAPDQVAAFIGPQIGSDALFVTPQAAPPERSSVLIQYTPVTQGVAISRRFHLDDLGSVVGQQATCEGTGQQLPNFNNPDSIQRTPGFCITHLITRVGAPLGAICQIIRLQAEYSNGPCNKPVIISCTGHAGRPQGHSARQRSCPQ